MVNKWTYDTTIKGWFKLCGHELKREDAGDFEKCIVQVNWCPTQNPNMKDVDMLAKLFEHRDYFINCVDYFKPKLILFFGVDMIKALNSKDVLDRFSKIMGDITEKLNFPSIPSKQYGGKNHNLSFQSFERCDVVSLPHPNAHVPDDYIKMFASEIGERIQKVKKIKNLS